MRFYSLFQNLTECEPCQMSRHISKAAKYWCSDCEEAVCAHCKISHSAMKHFQGHIFVELTSPSVMFRMSHQCGNHKGFKYEYYCFQHSSLCCVKCILEGHSGCNNLKVVADASREFYESEGLKTYKECLKKLSKSFDTLDTYIRKIKKNVEAEKEDIKSKIIAACKCHISNKQLQTRKDQLLAYVDESINKRLSTLNEQISDVSKCKTQINEIENSLESITKDFSPEKLYLTIQISKEYLEFTLTEIIKTKTIKLEVTRKVAGKSVLIEIHENKKELPRNISSLLPVKDKEIKNELPFLQNRLLR